MDGRGLPGCGRLFFNFITFSATLKSSNSFRIAMGKNPKKPAFGMLANTMSEKAMDVARQIFQKVHGDIIVEKGTATALNVDGVPLNHMDVDVLITIGGDGTVLRALQQNDAKILGINAGVVGFLTELGPKDAIKGIARVAQGKYTVDSRLKLRTTLNSKRLFDCTNEAVVHTAQIAKMGFFKIYIDGNLATSVRADGVIIATPTGSTSYALSLGGPLIDPAVEALVIVPIAPFKLSARPIVVPAESNIVFEIADENKPCLLVLDGQHSIEIGQKDRVQFTVSEKAASFIRFRGDFYSRVDEKLRF